MNAGNDSPLLAAILGNQVTLCLSKGNFFELNTLSYDSGKPLFDAQLLMQMSQERCSCGKISRN